MQNPHYILNCYDLGMTACMFINKISLFFIDFLFIFTNNFVCIINNKMENKKPKILLISPNVLTRLL